MELEKLDKANNLLNNIYAIKSELAMLEKEFNKIVLQGAGIEMYLEVTKEGKKFIAETKKQRKIYLAELEKEFNDL